MPRPVLSTGNCEGLRENVESAMPLPVGRKAGSQLKSVQLGLLGWFAQHGRATLPWRVVRDPYYTVVSEFMLQQTQVDRVIPKFAAFITRFPDFEALARASVADVLRAWQGLGYNSRALRLQQVAVAVVERFGGVMPRDPQALRSLPGVGPYTVAAIRAFAFDEDVAPVDTNVRRIVHRLFFGVEYPAQATAAELDARAQTLVPSGRGHDWSSAMMDLGATLCTARAPKCLVCPLRDTCRAAPIDAASLDALRKRHVRAPSPQNAIPFEATTRYARGRIVDRLRDLPPGARISLLDLHQDLASLLPNRSFAEIRDLVAGLSREGLVTNQDEAVALRD